MSLVTQKAHKKMGGLIKTRLYYILHHPKRGVILGSEDIEGGRSGRVSTYRGVIQVGEDIEGGHPRK